MKKKLFIVILLGLFLLGVTGCGDKSNDKTDNFSKETDKFSEEDLIGTSWLYIFEDIPSVEACYGFEYEFLEANMVNFSSLFASGNRTTTYTYEIEEGYLVIYELNGELSGKYKFNKDKTTLTSIGGKEVYFKRD